MAPGALQKMVKWWSSSIQQGLETIQHMVQKANPQWNDQLISFCQDILPENTIDCNAQ